MEGRWLVWVVGGWRAVLRNQSGRIVKRIGLSIKTDALKILNKMQNQRNSYKPSDHHHIPRKETLNTKKVKGHLQHQLESYRLQDRLSENIKFQNNIRKLRIYTKLI